MLPLFELGSLHRQRYLVNIKLRFIPLNDLMEEFKGLSQLSDVSLMVSDVAWSLTGTT